MILSHRHRFIFLKTNKTGGTSLEIALSRYCGPDDVITPISPDDEALRQTLGFRGSQNYRVPLSSYRARHWLTALRHGRRLRYYNHMSAAEVRLLAGDAVWNGYFKFCFERNPLDRVLSLYYYRHPRAPRPSLEDFIASDAILRLKRKGLALYLEDGRVSVDRVCRHECFAAELERLSSDLKLPGPLEAPRAKARHRAPGDEHVPPLSEQARRRIAQVFAEEIERYGYSVPMPQT